MALQPCLKAKVDELFLLWFSEPTTQAMLRSNLHQLLKGEPITRPPGMLVSLGSFKSGTVHQNSPRLRPASPSAPPCLPSSASPRSPRIRGSTKSSGRQSTGNHKVTSPLRDKNHSEKKENLLQFQRDRTVDSETFLRQKKDELLQKREQERQKTIEKDIHRQSLPSSANEGDSTFIITQIPPVTTSFKLVTLTEGVSNSSLLPNNNNALHSGEDTLNKDDHIISNVSKREPVSLDNIAKSEPVSLQNLEPVATKQEIKKDIKNTGKLKSTVQKNQKSQNDGSSPRWNLSENIDTNEQSNATDPSQTRSIPQFYFPMGRPASDKDTNDAVLQRLTAELEKVEGGRVTRNHMPVLVKACGFPLYWKNIFYEYLSRQEKGEVTSQGLLNAWMKMKTTCFDDAACFVRIIGKPDCNYIEFNDFLPLVQDVVDSHVGLIFLQEAPEFHDRYMQTVISRIFYCVNRSWTGRITAQEIRKSNLLQAIERLEEEEDINQITDYFSYEHFYVIYCKFWELDRDHDLLISKEDLIRHNDHAISSKMIDRIFSGAVTRNLVDGKMSYLDFVWFLISEEDKRHPRSIEYWFRCMDLDGDGIISMYEMEYFYEEQVEKMEMLGIETTSFQDCICQMLDMIRPEEEGKIRLKDLKSCALTPIFFDTFFNVDKYMDHEQRDPFASLRDQDGEEMSDWEKFAAEEYEMLVAEEGGQQDDSTLDDLEPELQQNDDTVNEVV